MKQAVVFVRGIKAGILTEDENGFTVETKRNPLNSLKFRGFLFILWCHQEMSFISK